MSSTHIFQYNTTYLEELIGKVIREHQLLDNPADPYNYMELADKIAHEVEIFYNGESGGKDIDYILSEAEKYAEYFARDSYISISELEMFADRARGMTW